MFEGVVVEEVEVGPALLVELENNMLDCIVGSMMLGRVQGMLGLVGAEVEEAEVGPPLSVENSMLDCTVGSTKPGRVQGMLAAVWGREVQGLLWEGVVFVAASAAG